MSPRTVLPLPATSFHILLALVDGPAHGYGIKHVVEERTGGRIRLAAGTLYEAISRMVSAGLLKEVATPAAFKRDRRRRRGFCQFCWCPMAGKPHSVSGIRCGPCVRPSGV